MTNAPARLALYRAAFIACLCTAGCAGTGMLDPSPQGPGSARTPTGQPIAPPAAVELIALGRSTKADIAAALGQAIAIPFDSGYEVWVYRWPGADRTTRAATELVLLFDPAGRAVKARVRLGYGTRD